MDQQRLLQPRPSFLVASAHYSLYSGWRLHTRFGYQEGNAAITWLTRDFEDLSGDELLTALEGAWLAAIEGRL